MVEQAGQFLVTKFYTYPQPTPSTPATAPKAQVQAGRDTGYCKLGKATYDMVIKIITDIGSETAKKICGL